jgi:GNAT superfamily N-acetyltransferase
MNNRELVSQMQIEVSPLKESDIDQFDPILTAHVRDSKTGEVITNEISAIKGYMRGQKDEYGRTRTYIVARDQSGRVLGCMAYSLPDPDMVQHFHLEHPEESIELLNAFVSADIFRGGGVGRKLLDAICDAGRAEAKKQLLIHSGPRYQKSWGFYDKMTDEQIDDESRFIQNKYGEGRHAKTWKKTL